MIGGGFIGSEIAAALALNGKEVVMIFPGKDIGDRLFPRPLAQFVSNYYKQKGVELLAGEKIIGLEKRGNQRVLKTGTNREIVVDGMVAGVGIEPNVELAKTAGLRWKTESSWTSSCAPAIPISMQRETLPHSTTLHWENASESNMRTTPIPWDGWRVGTWRANPSLIITCRSFTPICSIWDTKPSAKWIHAWRLLPTGSDPTTLAALANHVVGPGQLLERLDGFLARSRTMYFATVRYIVVDPATGALEYALAGHLLDACLSAAGDVTVAQWSAIGAALRRHATRSPNRQRPSSSRVGPLVLYSGPARRSRRKERFEDASRGSPTPAAPSSVFPSRRLCRARETRLGLDSSREDDVAAMAVG